MTDAALLPGRSTRARPRSRRFVFTHEGRQLVVYAPTSRQAAARLIDSGLVAPGDVAFSQPRAAGHVERDGTLRLPPWEEARLVADDRKAPGT